MTTWARIAGTGPDRRGALGLLLAWLLPMPLARATPEPAQPPFPSALAAYLQLSPAQIRELINRHERDLATEGRLQARLDALPARTPIQRDQPARPELDAAEREAAALRRRMSREQRRSRAALRHLLSSRQLSLLDGIAADPGLAALADEAAMAGLTAPTPAVPAATPCAAASGVPGKPRQDLCDPRM